MTMSKDPAVQTAYPCKTPDTRQPKVTWSVLMTTSTQRHVDDPLRTVASVIQSALDNQSSQFPNDENGHERSHASDGPRTGTSEVSPPPRSKHPNNTHNTRTSANPTSHPNIESTSSDTEAFYNQQHHTIDRATGAGTREPGAHISETSQLEDPHGLPSTKAFISKNSLSEYVINGETLAPSSPVTVTGEEGPVTIRMLTSSSRTLVALGTTTTLDTSGKSSSPSPLAFTRASDGNVVLHGTTLASGVLITIGDVGHRTTLRLTTVSNAPAIVVNGNTTELLGHNTQTRRPSVSKSISLPVITDVSTPVAPSRTISSVRSVTSDSGDDQRAGRRSSWSCMIVVAALCCAWT